ncbi:MAG TPA: hypothetical protein VHM91_08405, partial [Verrucomicrobiales bacterium]|nr:hypothetical protein [Verrucomicrobiales bacterium]
FLLPRAMLFQSLVAVQIELEIPKPGSLYLDDQPVNKIAHGIVLAQLSHLMNVSKSVLHYRLSDLGLLVDARRSERDHVQETVRALFSEE